MLISAIEKAYSQYGDISGRASRTEFWYFILFQFLCYAAIEITENEFELNNVPDSPFRILSWIFFLVNLVPNLTIILRRLNDIGKPREWILVFSIPIVGQVLMAVMLSSPGTAAADDIGSTSGSTAKRNLSDIASLYRNADRRLMEVESFLTRSSEEKVDGSGRNSADPPSVTVGNDDRAPGTAAPAEEARSPQAANRDTSAAAEHEGSALSPTSRKLAIGTLAFFLVTIAYPMAVEGVRGPCVALETRVFREFAQRDGVNPLIRMGAGFLSASGIGADGYLASEAMKTKIPMVPPALSCGVTYWAIMFGYDSDNLLPDEIKNLTDGD